MKTYSVKFIGPDAIFMWICIDGRVGMSFKRRARFETFSQAEEAARTAKKAMGKDALHWETSISTEGD